MPRMFIVDAHLDISYCGLHGRDLTQPADRQGANADGTATVGFPDLRLGQVGLICATIFCAPARDGKPGYHDGDEAHAAAATHLDWYRRQFDAGELRLVDTADKVPTACSADKAIPAIILLEGADPLRNDDDAADFFARGMRIVGLAWNRTRLAGGTGAPGPLTGEGVRLVGALDRLGVIQDISHLAEESFWQLLDLCTGPVMASHSNCREFVNTDRQLSDAMIRAIVARNGVIGINFYDKFLIAPAELAKRRATLVDVVRHVQYMCDLAGDARHVGIGSDMDGGFGREQLPLEIRTSADLPRLADALHAANFSDPDIHALLGRNWSEFFAQSLPKNPA